jgi:hypothetical protein
LITYSDAIEGKNVVGLWTITFSNRSVSPQEQGNGKEVSRRRVSVAKQ